MDNVILDDTFEGRRKIRETIRAAKRLQKLQTEVAKTRYVPGTRIDGMAEFETAIHEAAVAKRGELHKVAAVDLLAAILNSD